MAGRSFKPIFGKRIRVTSLGNCGELPQPDTPDAMVVTTGFTTLSLSVDVEDGVEILTKRADGSLCVNFRDRNMMKRMNVEIEFCGVDPSLLAITSNAEAYDNYLSDPTGFVMPEGKIEKQFSLELWTGIDGACEPGRGEEFGYMLLPMVAAGTIGDVEVDGENALNFTMTGAFTMPNMWESGPYNVLDNAAGDAAPLPTPMKNGDHFLMIPTTIVPPEDSDGLQPFTPDVAPAVGP